MNPHTLSQEPEICGIEYCSHEGQENPDICTNRPYFTCEGCGERRCKKCRYYFNVPIPAPMSALGFTYSMFCPNCKNTFGICCSAEHVKECTSLLAAATERTDTPVVLVPQAADSEVVTRIAGSQSGPPAPEVTKFAGGVSPAPGGEVEANIRDVGYRPQERGIAPAKYSGDCIDSLVSSVERAEKESA